MTSVIQVKRGSASAWTSANTVLAAGEVGFETDTKKMKVGDGSTAWTSLTYTVTDGDITAVVAGTGLSGGSTSGSATLAIDTSVVVDKTTAQTLTNKTLTTPIISSISNTGTVTLPTSTDTLVGRDTTDTLTNKTIDAASNTLTGVTTLTGTQTLTNKTLTSPAITGGTLVNTVIKGLEEDVNVVASAATGTINFDVETASIWYYTSNASANHTLNFRYNSSTSLDSSMATGDAITLVWLNTNGSTAYYPNTIQIDGSAVTPKVPAAISAGNASSIDAYSFTIIKTASATFTVLETQTKFA
jgi:hypothetical protein